MSGIQIQTRWRWDVLLEDEQPVPRRSCRMNAKIKTFKLGGLTPPARHLPWVLLLFLLCFAGCASDSWFGRSATPSVWPFGSLSKEDADEAAVRKRRKIKSDIPPAKERGLEYKPQDD